MAQDTLAVMYEDGKGVPQDYAEAVNWFRKAADQGYPRAQSLLGSCTAKVSVYRKITRKPISG